MSAKHFPHTPTVSERVIQGGKAEATLQHSKKASNRRGSSAKAKLSLFPVEIFHQTNLTHHFHPFVGVAVVSIELTFGREVIRTTANTQS